MDPISVLGGLSSLMGIGAGMDASDQQERLMRMQLALYRQFGDQWQRYMPQINQQLLAEYHTPYTADLTAGLSDLEARSQLDLTAELPILLRNLKRAGVADSTGAESVEAALLDRQADRLAAARSAAQGEARRRREAARAQLTSNVAGMGQAAAAGFGQQAAMYGQEAGDLASGLSGLWAAIANSRQQPARPPAGNVLSGWDQPAATLQDVTTLPVGQPRRPY